MQNNTKFANIPTLAELTMDKSPLPNTRNLCYLVTISKIAILSCPTMVDLTHHLHAQCTDGTSYVLLIKPDFFSLVVEIKEKDDDEYFCIHILDNKNDTKEPRQLLRKLYTLILTQKNGIKRTWESNIFIASLFELRKEVLMAKIRKYFSSPILKTMIFDLSKQIDNTYIRMMCVYLNISPVDESRIINSPQNDKTQLFGSVIDYVDKTLRLTHNNTYLFNFEQLKHIMFENNVVDKYSETIASYQRLHRRKVKIEKRRKRSTWKITINGIEETFLKYDDLFMEVFYLDRFYKDVENAAHIFIDGTKLARMHWLCVIVITPRQNYVVTMFILVHKPKLTIELMEMVLIYLKGKFKFLCSITCDFEKAITKAAHNLNLKVWGCYHHYMRNVTKTECSEDFANIACVLPFVNKQTYDAFLNEAASFLGNIDYMGLKSLDNVYFRNQKMVKKRIEYAPARLFEYDIQEENCLIKVTNNISESVFAKFKRSYRTYGNFHVTFNHLMLSQYYKPFTVRKDMHKRAVKLFFETPDYALQTAVAQYVKKDIKELTQVSSKFIVGMFKDGQISDFSILRDTQSTCVNAEETKAIKGKKKAMTFQERSTIIEKINFSATNATLKQKKKKSLTLISKKLEKVTKELGDSKALVKEQNLTIKELRNEIAALKFKFMS